MCKSVDSNRDIPFLSIDLSFNVIQLPRYKLVLDSTYLKANVIQLPRYKLVLESAYS